MGVLSERGMQLGYIEKLVVEPVVVLVYVATFGLSFQLEGHKGHKFSRARDLGYILHIPRQTAASAHNTR